MIGAEMTFDEIVKSVARRESRTGAILNVRASKEARAQGARATYTYFEMRIEGKTAKVEMYNNYLNGKEGETFEFPVSPEIQAEYARLQNLARLRNLDQAVADAERKRRIYVLSSFRLQEGSSRMRVDGVFGKPEQVVDWMKGGWTTLVYKKVSITLAYGKVQDVRANGQR